MERLHLLILDDDKLCLKNLSVILSRQNFKVFCADNPALAFEIIDTHSIDFFFCDISMPEMNGLEILKRVRKQYPLMDVIMISAIRDIDKVVEAFRLGAIDYINKPTTLDEILEAIKRTDRYNQTPVRVIQGSSKWSLIPAGLIRSTGREFIGRSNRIKEVLKLAMLAAAEKDINILITGENGTGKEIIARVIHHSSDRKGERFHPINCAAIPDTLIESEFFGHKKGTFTGAVEDRKGCFELASKGTLFLDEISEMPFELQAKLLRAIEEKRIKPLGSNEELQCDFRIISATNAQPDTLIATKKLRIDLFHRLNTVTLHIPPLRDRPQDIAPLTCFFVNQITERRKESRKYINPDVIPHLKSYHFPGNVRELRNMVERAMLLADNKLTPDHFVLPGRTETIPHNNNKNLNVEDNERQLIINALIQCDNNNSHAAKLLGISRDTLLRKRKKYEIKAEDTFH